MTTRPTPARLNRPFSLTRAAALVLTAGTLSLTPIAPTVRADEPLPSDPALVTGTLENGLRYIVRKHATPPGRVAAWMHVSTGSLNETDAQRGLAHYLEHMAFNGSANFAPGSVVPFFESLGMRFGRDQNAFTSFDQTTYILALADNKPENFSKGLLFFSDIAFRLTLPEKEIESERGIILEERRSRLSAQQRVQDYFLARLAPGSLFGERLPIGTAESIAAVQRPEFVEYYTRNYTASNIALIVVGDMEPAAVVEEIRKQFAEGKKVERPADQDPKVTPTVGRRAIVATDPELTTATVGVTRIDRPQPPTTTEGRKRLELVETIGQFAFNRRTQNNVDEGKASYQGASASSADLFNALRFVQATAEGKPDAWGAMLKDLAVDLERARLHGFADDEVDSAKREILAGAEQFAQREGTLPAGALLGRYNNAVAQGEPIMSAAQNLEVVKKLLPGITAAEVNARFAQVFDTQNAIFTAELPASANVPTEEEFLRLGVEAVSVKPEKAAAAAKAARLLDEAPKAGTIAEQSEHTASAVASAWLGNGVRFHHRFMDARKNTVTVTITLAGGVIAETAANRGITEAAALAFAKPATKRLTAVQVREFMTGKKVTVSLGGPPGSDALTLTVSGSPEDLETGMQLAYLLLTEPRVEKAAFDTWRQEQEQEISGRRMNPQGALREAISDALFPKGEVRTRPLSKAQVDALTPEAAQAWLENLVATAPIEVAVVGDLSRERANALVQTYLGSLPNRARVGPGYMAEARRIKRAPGMVQTRTEVDTKTPVAVVVGGFFGPDASNVRDTRLMNLALNTLNTRMNKVIREERQLVYSISAIFRPGEAFPGYGVVLAPAPTEPSKVPALSAAVFEVIDALMKEGPTEEELGVAKKQMANTLDEQFKEPGFWSGRLANLTYRGQSLDDVTGGPASYAALTAAEVKSTFGAYAKPEARFSIAVAPKGEGAAPAAAPAPAPGK